MNLDSMMYRYLWNPTKVVREQIKFPYLEQSIYFFNAGLSIGLLCAFNQQWFSESVLEILPIAFSLIGLTMVLISFTERRVARLSWLLVIMTIFG